MKVSQDFIEKVVESFDSNELVKLLEKGGPTNRIISILDQEVNEAYEALSIDSSDKWAREVAVGRAHLATKFKRLLNRIPS